MISPQRNRNRNEGKTRKKLIIAHKLTENEAAMNNKITCFQEGKRFCMAFMEVLASTKESTFEQKHIQH
jgi:hypothetical protein